MQASVISAQPVWQTNMLTCDGFDQGPATLAGLVVCFHLSCPHIAPAAHCPSAMLRRVHILKRVLHMFRRAVSLA